MLVKIALHWNITDFLRKVFPHDSVEMARDYMFGVHNVRV
jgi:hypothetical protein